MHSLVLDKSLYSLVNNNKLQLNTRILYDDVFTIGSNKYLAIDFENNVDLKNLFIINTDINLFYFKKTDVIIIRDFLNSNLIGSKKYDQIDIGDYLFLPFREHSHTNNKLNINQYLYLEAYDYSVSFPEIIKELNLPKHFLEKALFTGCPDLEFDGAEDLNLKLKNILVDKKYESETELVSELVNKYTSKINKSAQNILVNDSILNLIFLCIIGSYELLSHTTIKLIINDTTMFQNILAFLIKYNINKTVINDIYNNSQSSIIKINSKFIYNLFKTNFNNFSLILDLNKNNTEFLLTLLNNQSTILLPNLKCTTYLIEFFYRSRFLYAFEKNSNMYVLNKLSNNKFILDLNNQGFLLPILDINSDLKGIDHKLLTVGLKNANK